TTPRCCQPRCGTSTRSTFGADSRPEARSKRVSPSGTFEHPNEPFGPWRYPVRVPIFRPMSERGLRQIEDDLSDTWLEDWAGAGVAEIEAYLAKHAAFLSFLDSQEA